MDKELNEMTMLDSPQLHKAVITRVEAAQMLACDPRTVSRGIANNEIPSITVGRRTYVLRDPFFKMLGIAD